MSEKLGDLPRHAKLKLLLRLGKDPPRSGLQTAGRLRAPGFIPPRRGEGWMTPLSPAAPAPAPARPARPGRAHANALGPDPAVAEGVRGARGPAVPSSGRVVRQRGAGAQGGARAEQGRPGPHPAACPPARSPDRPAAPGKARTATSASGPPSAGHTQRPGRRPPGAGAAECAAARPPPPGAAQAPPRPASRGTPAYLGASAAALSRAGARRWWPLQSGGRAEGEPQQGRSASGLDSFTASTPRRQPHAGTLPPAQPPPPARPSVSLTRSTHPASAPRSGLHTRRRSRLPGFCIRSHARSDTDPVPPPALPSSFPTLLSRRIPYTASALCSLARHQPPPLPLQTSASPPPTPSPKLPTAIQTPVTTRWRSKRIVLSYPGKRTLRPQHRLQRRDASPGRR